MNHRLRILAGGAVKSLVLAAAKQMGLQDGITLQATFGAVGAMRDLLLDGEPCDVVILSRSLIDELALKSDHGESVIDIHSITDIGLVCTGLAVRSTLSTAQSSAAKASLTEEAMQAKTGKDLREVLLGASAIFVPDPVRSTAGAHVMKVLNQLGLASVLEGRLRGFPHGAAAMKALSESDDPKAIGCTQKTEILMTPGLRYLADLPEPFALQTLYTGAITSQTDSAVLAARLLDWMAGEDYLAQRESSGFKII
jgi:molybdate transport system substrate-binding protein